MLKEQEQVSVQVTLHVATENNNKECSTKQKYSIYLQYLKYEQSDTDYAATFANLYSPYITQLLSMENTSLTYEEGERRRAAGALGPYPRALALQRKKIMLFLNYNKEDISSTCQ